MYNNARLRIFVLPALALAVVFTCRGPALSQNDQADKERNLLQGNWQVVTLFYQGQELDASKEKMLFMIKGSKIVVKLTEEVLGEATFTLDAGKTPKAIDFKRERPFMGIYQVNENELKICVSPPQKDRPKAFSSDPANGQSLVVLKRIK